MNMFVPTYRGVPAEVKNNIVATVKELNLRDREHGIGQTGSTCNFKDQYSLSESRTAVGVMAVIGLPKCVPFPTTA